MIKCEQDSHTEHDYCILVESVSIEKTVQRTFKINRIIIPVLNNFLPDIVTESENNIPFLKADNHLKITTNNIYILHNSFLI